MTTPHPLIELKNLAKTYQLGEMAVPVLKGISLTVERGEFVALMGASGSGKTTLMNLLGCLDRPTSGAYWLDGVEISRLSADELAFIRNHELGFVFQSFNLLPRTTALDNVAMPLSYAGQPLSGRDSKERAQALLTRLGLGDRLDHEPSQLSGGQQQRVAIARSLVNRPSLLFADEPTGNLDSQTSVEVLKILKELNQEEGITIILVTHDEGVAHHAGRVIRICDGMVQENPPACPTAPPGAAPLPPAREPGKGAPVRRSSRWGRTLHTALNGLRRNVLRAALTTLGIVIGIAAVIAMMEIGSGSSRAIEKTIANMGANNIMVLPGAAASGGVTFGGGSAVTLTPEDCEAILAECPAVVAATPVVRARAQVVRGNRNWVPIYINGVTPDYLAVRNCQIERGEMFSERDVRNASKVCVLGQTLVRELFQEEDPLGKEVRVRNVAFKVVGILAAQGANMMGMDQDDILLAPWTSIKFRVAAKSLTNTNQSASESATTINTLNNLYPSSELKRYPEQSALQAADTPTPRRFTNVDNVMVAAASAAEIASATTQITQLLRERHRLRPGQDDDFNLRDMTEISKALSSTTNLMTRLLLAVAMISLVVGGVGIMNIMLVSVTERTREIGLRMAVGAQRRDLLRQFLSESVILCFCGGAVGVLIGRGISYLVSTILGWPTAFSIEAVVSAFAVSASVGIIFGYYPAWKASRLDPINALRYE